MTHIFKDNRIHQSVLARYGFKGSYVNLFKLTKKGVIRL